MVSQTRSDAVSKPLHVYLSQCPLYTQDSVNCRIVHLDAKGAYKDGGQHHEVAPEERAIVFVSFLVQWGLER